jgi:hypothetical protein
MKLLGVIYRASKCTFNSAEQETRDEVFTAGVEMLIVW